MWGYSRVHMTKIKLTVNSNEDLKDYTMTRPEFAKMIGKSIGAVKQDMRRGKYKDLYCCINGKYFFKGEKRMRDIKVNVPLSNVPLKKINRGNHFKANYPNDAFKKHNEMKMLLKLKRSIPEERALDYLKDYDNWEHHKQRELQKQIHKSTEPLKYYGGRYNLKDGRAKTISWSTNWTEIFPKPKDEYQKYLEDNNLSNKPKKTYY